MKVKAILLIVSVLIFSWEDFAFSATLTDVEIDSKDEGTAFTFLLDTKLNKPNVTVEYINRTIQINLPEVRLERNRSFKDVSGELFRNIYSYQTGDNISHVRLNLNKGFLAENLKTNVEMEFEDSTFTVFVKSPSSVVSSRKLELPTKKVAKENAYIDKANPEVDVDAELKEMERIVLSSDETLSTDSNDPILAVARAQTEQTKSKKKALPEDKIPVLSKNSSVELTENWAPMKKAAAGLFIVLVMFAGLLVLVKKFKGKTSNNKYDASIKVIKQHHLGPKKSLAIVRVLGESILIGITDQNISMIKTLSLLDEDVPSNTPNKFDSTLDEHEFIEEPYEEGEEYTDGQREEAIDDFSYAGIKDVIASRLKGMGSKK